MRAAIEQAEIERAEAEELARQSADKAQREETAKDLHKIADDLEKDVASVPSVLQSLHEAYEAAGPVLPLSGLPQLLQNLSVEIPEIVAGDVGALRARADQTLQGTAPPNMPAPPVLTIIGEVEPLAPVTVSIFSLESLSWIDERGQRQNCGAFQIRDLPVKAAQIALVRGLAIDPTSPRYKAIREQARTVGWPHLSDPTKIFDLDRDPNTATVYSSGGKRLRDEPTFTQIDRGPSRQASWVEPPGEKF